MQLLRMLRDQANVLRDIATLQGNEQTIRRQILDLAERCDQLADDRQRELIMSGVLGSVHDAA